MQELGAPEEAHTAFSSAIMLCSALPQAWLSWGAFCDSRARNDGPQWTQHAVSAYLQVALCRPKSSGPCWSMMWHRVHDQQPPAFLTHAGSEPSGVLTDRH